LGTVCAPRWTAERGLLLLSAVNLVGAVLVRLLGASLHPMFSDPDAALLFLVTALGLAAHAMVLAMMRRRLDRPSASSQEQLRRLRGFMRLPLCAAYSAQRRSPRLRIGGRPARRPFNPGVWRGRPVAATGSWPSTDRARRCARLRA